MRIPKFDLPRTVVLAIVVLSVLTLVQVVQIARDAERLSDDLAQANIERGRFASDLRQTRASQAVTAEQAEALVRQVERLGGEPVVEPEEIPEPSAVPPVVGKPGAPGPPPSAAQVALAVESYCADNNECRGPAGASVTSADVASAVATYCDGGVCAGPSGSDGSDGTDGEDSTVPGPSGEDGTDGVDGEDGTDSTVPGPRGAEGPRGPGPECSPAEGGDGCQGPPPTAEQVARAVQDYCATRNECRGPQGEKGEPGQDGADGQDGTARPGTYDCGEGQFVQGFTVTDSGDIVLNCQPVPTFPGNGQP